MKVAVRIGENARLSCRMMASPNDVMFTWRYEQNDERIRRMLGTQDTQGSELVHNDLDLTVGYDFTNVFNNN
jgi:hypothetical protein